MSNSLHTNGRRAPLPSTLLAFAVLLGSILAPSSDGAMAQDAYYKLDETSGTVAQDSSGNGHDGTLVNGPVSVPAPFDSGLSFDGASQYVATGYTTNLPEWSVALWVWSPSSPGSGAANAPIHRERNFVISWNHPVAAFRGAAALSVGGNWHAASFGPIAPNTWYHLAATYDGETLRAYRDGVLITSNTTPSGPSDAETAPLTIGRHSVVDNYFGGDIDDVFIIPRAISAAEVQDVMVSSADGVDQDQDGMPDSWENRYGLNPADPADAGFDPDGDGLTNLDEFLQGTNPVVLFPQANWSTRTPAQVSLDQGLIDLFAATVAGDGVIIKDGHIIKTWGNHTASGGSWWSSSKAVLSTMMLFAVEEGKLGSVDDLISDWNPNLNPQDSTMTFRHLSNNTGGYMLTEGPGAAWAYNDFAINLYLKTLFHLVFGDVGGANPADSAAIKPQRLGALGMQDGNIYIPWTDGGWEIGASARDFARIAWFWLNRGEWDGQQLIDRELLDQHMQVGVPYDFPLASGNLDPSGDYLGVGTNGGPANDGLTWFNNNGGRNISGFHWWYNEQLVTLPTRMWPDAQSDVFGAISGTRSSVFVIPSLNMVVAARESAWGDNEAQRNANLKILMDAAGVPARPANVSVADSGSGSVDVDWDDSSAPDLAGYNIYHSVSSGGPLTRLNANLLPTSDFNHLQPVLGFNYYVISIVDSDGNESAFSDQMSVEFQSAPLAGSPSLHYKFDEGAGTVAVDSSGNGHNGSLINGPAYAPGTFGTALSFNGVNQHVASGYNSNLQEWSVAAWIRSPSSPSAGTPSGPVHRERNFAISWDHPSPLFRGVAALSVGGNWHAASFGQLAPDTWYHLVATYDGETLSAYKDGALVATNTDPSGPADAESAEMTVGKHAVTGGYFAGDIDDVLVFPRAIGAAEVLTVMNDSANPDTTSPQISNISAVPTSPTTATVSWETNEPTSNTVNYGTSAALGQSMIDANLTQSPSLNLTGLTPSQTYFYEVVSVDSSNNATVDDNGGAFYSFTTPATVSAPVISNVAISNVTGSSATITWTTDVAADSSVEYGTSAALGQTESEATLVLDHSVVLNGLASDTEYFLQVSSTNSGGATIDDNGGLLYSFTTTAIAAPVISNVQVSNVTSDSATITWDTNVASDSSVEYGTTAALGQVEFDANPVTTHSVDLSGLGGNTTYLFEVSSANGGGTTVDDNGGSLYNFTTSSGGGMTFSNIQVINLTATSADITWQTNVPSHSSVERNTQPVYFQCPFITFNPQSDPFYCTVWNQLPTTNPVIHLAELQPNTEYHFRVRGAIADGGEIWSQIAPFSFTTPSLEGVPVVKQIASSADDAHEAPGGVPAYSHTATTVGSGAFDTNPVTGGWRWTGLDIPAGAVITEAWVEFQQNDFGDGMVTLLSLEDSPNPAPFSAVSKPPDRWASRTQWEIEFGWPHTDVVGSTITTAALVNGVQELVDRYGGIDTIVLLEQGLVEEPNLYHQWSAFDLDPAVSGRLHIQYVDPSDVTTPIISNVQVVPGATSATISWDTNEPSNSRVNFGETTGLGETKFDLTFVTSHVMNIDTLEPSTNYFFEVESQDRGANTATDDNAGAYYSFQTQVLPPPPQYVAYAFDNGAGTTAFDGSGNGRHGTLINGPLWVPGQSGTALSFNGSSSYVESNQNDDLAEWSVALWVRSPNAPTGGAANGPVHREKNFAITWNHNSSLFRGAAAMSVGGTWHSASFGPLNGNTWYHLVATYDGESLKTYKDGVLVTTNDAPSGPPDAEVSSLKIGRHAAADNYFEGEIDEVIVFERALTAGEVQSLIP